MKKIFAIALALVMVLSMTAAFAACPTIDWACSTSVCTDGKGSVEVIPYVKGNACLGNSYTANTCAGAVNGDNVYFAVKVTVEANANADWWKEATLSMTKKGLGDVTFTGGYKFDVATVAVLEDLDEAIKTIAENKGELKAGEYFLVYASGWDFVPAADYDPTEGHFYAQVTDASKAKVCFALKSAVDASEGDWYAVGDYFVRWNNGTIQVSNKTEAAAGRKVAQFNLNSSDKIETVTYEVWGEDATAQPTTYTLTAFGFVDNNGKNVGNTCAPFDWLAKVMEYFKFDFRNTCYTVKAFKANFGWEDKVESCFSWSDKVQAVVDAECVVAIPKTGDMSVLAWLF